MSHDNRHVSYRSSRGNILTTTRALRIARVPHRSMPASDHVLLTIPVPLSDPPHRARGQLQAAVRQADGGNLTYPARYLNLHGTLPVLVSMLIPMRLAHGQGDQASFGKTGAAHAHLSLSPRPPLIYAPQSSPLRPPSGEGIQRVVHYSTPLRSSSATPAHPLLRHFVGGLLDR